MPQVYIKADIDWIAGYLRYGHKEGGLFIPEKEMNKFRANPIKYLEDNDLLDDLNLIIDDYRIEDMGDISNVSYNVLY